MKTHKKGHGLIYLLRPTPTFVFPDLVHKNTHSHGDILRKNPPKKTRKYKIMIKLDIHKADTDLLQQGLRSGTLILSESVHLV